MYRRFLCWEANCTSNGRSPVIRPSSPGPHSMLHPCLSAYVARFIIYCSCRAIIQNALVRPAANNQIFTYPIEMYVARHVFDVSAFQTSLGMGPITSKRHYAITLAIWALTMTVACSTDDLGFVLDIFGALSSTVSRTTERSYCEPTDGATVALETCCNQPGYSRGQFLRRTPRLEASNRFVFTILAFISSVDSHTFYSAGYLYIIYIYIYSIPYLPTKSRSWATSCRH